MADACDTCINGSPWVTDGGHTTGFYRCSGGARWEFVSPKFGCMFRPSLYAPLRQAPASSAAGVA